MGSQQAQAAHPRPSAHASRGYKHTALRLRPLPVQAYKPLMPPKMDQAFWQVRPLRRDAGAHARCEAHAAQLRATKAPCVWQRGRTAGRTSPPVHPADPNCRLGTPQCAAACPDTHPPHTLPTLRKGGVLVLEGRRLLWAHADPATSAHADLGEVVAAATAGL